MIETAPTGILTLMFTDIPDSTVRWERMGDRFRSVLERHNELIRDRIQRWDGYEVKTQGDSFMVAFERGTDAIQCALEIQRALWEEAWPAEVGELLVRLGLHTGEPFLGYDAAGRPDYFGPVVNRAARIADAGHGGQILISSATRDVVEGALTGDLELINLGQHRLRGLDQTEQLFEVRHPDLPQRRFPPLRTLDTLRTNLPVHLTTFVGRGKELTDLRGLLGKPETRLLTLTGPGGSGKTRLAHEVASDCAGSFRDGVWLVSLAELNEPENVLPQIAAAAQLSLLPDRDAREQLIAFLGERQLLLVLDSFEYVMGASLLLSDLLKSAPRVRILVTSRIALRLHGEQEYTLPPLRTPDPRVTPPDQLLQFDSVTLFVERARAVRAEFVLTASNAPAVAALCRQLDGIPLAIELAAAQVAEMSVAEVLEGLQSRLDLLSSESPDLPERHRTLRAAIDGSYCLLSPAEQRALQQLSVFAGGCARDGLQAVGGPEAVAALRALRRHSMLTTTETTAGRTRYVLLDMVRDYARSKLEEMPERARDAAERHDEYYLQFAEARVALMRTRDEARALDELGEELDNLRAAMERAQLRQQSERCARLALALYEPLHRRGFWEEARWRLQAGWAATSAGPGAGLPTPPDAAEDPRRLRAGISHHLASLAEDMGDLAEARRQAEESLALRRELNDPQSIADGLNLLGRLAFQADEPDAARDRFEEALQLLPGGDHPRRGRVLHNLGLLAGHRGDADEARQLYEESLAHLRTAGDLHDEARLLGDLGALAQGSAHDYAGARRLYQESLTLYRALGDRDGIAVMLNNLGELAELEGDVETATILLVHAERIFRDLGSVHAAVPAASLRRLAGQVGAERWSSLRAAAERATWEEAVG
jgi:predicted ATPase/class 3 adenylate cyclase